MKALSVFYLVEKMIREGAPKSDMDMAVPLLRSEISALSQKNMKISMVGTRSAVEVDSILLEVVAHFQAGVFKDYAPQMMVLALAYLRRDPDMADYLLSFYPDETAAILPPETSPEVPEPVPAPVPKKRGKKGAGPVME